MQMALDTSGAWEPGDDLRLIEALGSGFSEYILKGIGVCMNDVERISAGAVPRIRALLVRYEAGQAAKVAADVSNPEGKTLVKADVLEWAHSTKNGAVVEMAAARSQLMDYFSACPYVARLTMGTPLIRS
jgi:hypothetical protein